MLKIEQTASEIKDSLGNWSWSVWLDGDEKELNLVRNVRYQLHPTFSPPVRLVEDRKTRFRLDGTGWGEFAIYATVNQYQGPPIRLQHWLQFGDEARSKDGFDRPKAFLSHSATDSAFASALEHELQGRGVNVVRLETLAATSRPFRDVVLETIEEAPAGIVLVSKDSSSWVVDEVEAMLANNSYVIPVGLSQGPTRLRTRLSGLQFMEVEAGTASEDAVKIVADQTAAILKRQGII